MSSTKTAPTAPVAPVAPTIPTSEPVVKKNRGGAPRIEDRIPIQFAAPRTDIVPPTSSRSGAKSALTIALEKLEVGQSIGLLNKTKAKLSSYVSKLNSVKDNLRPVINAATGEAVLLEGEPIKDAAGTVVAHKPGKPKMEMIRKYEVHDVDPNEDQDKATARIFRVK